MPKVWKKKINGPQNFNEQATLTGADFTNPTYVQAAYHPRSVAEPWDYTVYAYTFIPGVDGYTICGVGHAHISANNAGQVNNSANWGPGNSFIPGLENWSLPTPGPIVTVLYNQYHAQLAQAVGNNALLPGGVTLSGAFPGDNRYPH